MNTLLTLTELQKAWQKKYFDQAQPLLINLCESLIALEDFQKKVLSETEAAMGTMHLFQQTGVDRLPEGSAPDVVFKRVLNIAAGSLTPAPGETVH